MRFVKILFKGIFWLLILALLIAPLGLIYQISNREMQQYVMQEPPVFRETAFGTVYQAERRDVEEAITVSGTFLSHTYDYIELEQRYPNQIRWNVSVGDEIQQGQVLGMYKGDEVLSPLDGILEEINPYAEDSPYLKVRLLEPVELECNVTDRELTTLKRSEELKTEYDEAVQLTYAARAKNPDGTTRVRLAIDADGYTYGSEVKELKLLTGHAYLQALVLSTKCLYQRTEGEKEPWYARKVTADGFFLDEVEVEVGYRSGGVACVSGIEAGEYFDSGYQAIAKEKMS